MKRFMSLAMVVLAAGGLLSACASAARSTAMVAPITAKTLIDVSNPLHKSMIVRTVSGGQETNILWQSKVSSGDFRNALETSLDLTTILGSAANSTLMVDATLESLEQPQLAVNLEVITTVLYQVRSFSGEVVFEERVKTKFTTEFLESFVRSERQRLANEGSVKLNIAVFLEKLVAASKADPDRFRPAS